MTYIDSKVSLYSGIYQSSEKSALWKLSSLIIAAYVIFPLSYWSLLAFDPPFIKRLVTEDGFIETLGAFFYLSATLILFLLFYRSIETHNRLFGISTHRNYFILLLAAFFLLCFGEEISWGQRIIGWNTPHIWAEINSQSETNIHNLWIFKGTYQDGTEKSFLEKLTDHSRLLSMFWLTYCVLIPMFYIVSNRLKVFLNFSGLPIPSIVVGGLFVANYISYRLATATVDVGVYHAFIELKETNNAAIFAILAVYFLVRHDFVRDYMRARPIGKPQPQ